VSVTVNKNIPSHRPVSASFKDMAATLHNVSGYYFPVSAPQMERSIAESRGTGHSLEYGDADWPKCDARRGTLRGF
jgi:hypothetical protein